MARQNDSPGAKRKRSDETSTPSSKKTKHSGGDAEKSMNPPSDSTFRRPHGKTSGETLLPRLDANAMVSAQGSQSPQRKANCTASQCEDSNADQKKSTRRRRRGHKREKNVKEDGNENGEIRYKLLEKSRQEDARPDHKSEKNREKHPRQDSGQQKSSRRRSRHQKRLKDGHGNNSSGWSMGNSVGGRYLEIPPVFSEDEEHIFLATENAAHMYSTNTSALERSFPTEPGHSIAFLSMPPFAPEILSVTSTEGRIVHWNWTSGKMLNCWTTNNLILGIAEASEGVVLTISRSKKSHVIQAQDLTNFQNEATTLLRCDRPIMSLQTIKDGDIIIATAVDSILIGKRATNTREGFEENSYSWQVIKCTESPLCFDLRSRGGILDIVVGGLKGCIYVYQNVLNKIAFGPASSKSLDSAALIKARELHWHREGVSAVAWSRDGNYIISGGQETVLVLWQLETGKKQFLPHLESPIHDLTISPTGASYAVGLEDNSVMILSTSELKPTANFAGLQSPSVAHPSKHQVLLPTKELMTRYLEGEAPSNIPALINPNSPNDLITAVPASHPANDLFPANEPCPYLQTFELLRTRHMERQALTRTNATNTNQAPTGNRIHTPSLTCLQISQNSRWLASVDIWKPRREDLEDLILNPEEASSELSRYQEVQLKFWAKHTHDEQETLNSEVLSDAASWQLNSRIDLPHQIDNLRVSGRILDLAAHPCESSFATVGDDAVVRFWTPKTRTTDGKIVRGDFPAAAPSRNKSSRKTDISQTWWSLRAAVPIPQAHRPQLDANAEHDHLHEDSLEPLQPSRAMLAFSNDGSTLAAHLHFPSATKSVIHFIDTMTFLLIDSWSALNGQQRTTSSLKKTTPITAGDDGIHGISFLERYLLVLCRHSINIHDVTTFELTHNIRLPSSSHPDLSVPMAKPPPPQLATNSLTSTFSVAAPVARRGYQKGLSNSLPPHPWRDYTTQILVFRVRDALWKSDDTSESNTVAKNNDLIALLFSATLPRLILRLMSAAGDINAGSSQDAKGSSRKPTSDEISGLHDEGRHINTQAQKKGYVVLDASAHVRRIVPDSVALTSMKDGQRDPQQHFEASMPRANACRNLVLGSRGDGTVSPSEEHYSLEIKINANEERKPDEAASISNSPASITRDPAEKKVVNPERLAEVVDPRSDVVSQLPSVANMFDAVLRLYSGNVQHR